MKKILLTTLILTFLQLISIQVKAQTYDISTFAGAGTSGFSGDGAAATAAQLFRTKGVTIDASGNVYIADTYNNRIRKINTSGIISTIAGNGTFGYSGDGSAATASELAEPFALAIDAAGNIYIADTYNQCIRKVNTSGIISTVVGNGIDGYSGDGGTATAAELDYPEGIAVDASGNLYIADTGNNCIRKVNTSGIISTIAGNGTFGYSGDGGVATAAEFYYPTGITLDAAGNIYTADTFNHCIRKVNTSGIISTIAGDGVAGYSGDGGAATAAKFQMPFGVVVDSSGNLYVSDTASSVVRKINTSGIINTIAGNGTWGFSGDGGLATSAQFFTTWGIAVDASGNIYVADDRNNRIRELTEATSVAENNFANASISVFPNPSTGIFNVVQKNIFQKSSLEIYNVLGEKIISTTLNASQTQIDLSSQAKGIYFYKVVSEDGKNISDGKLVVQ